MLAYQWLRIAKAVADSPETLESEWSQGNRQRRVLYDSSVATEWISPGSDCGI